MEVIYPSMKGGRKVFPTWENPPDSVADIDLSSVQDKLPGNVDMAVAPKDFAELVKGAKPQLVNCGSFTRRRRVWLLVGVMISRRNALRSS